MVSTTVIVYNNTCDIGRHAKKYDSICTWIFSYSCSIIIIVVVVVIWPGSMLSVDLLDMTKFDVWTILSRTWAFIAATFIIIVPLFQEVGSHFFI